MDDRSAKAMALMIKWNNVITHHINNRNWARVLRIATRLERVSKWYYKLHA